MTDRYVALTVILDKEIRSDDCEPIIDAIKMIKHVLKVQPIVADAGTYWGKETARMELQKKLWDVLNEKG